MSLPFLTSRDLFGDLSESDARTVSGRCRERRYRTEATLFREGDPSDALFIIREGLVKLVSVSDRGTPTILHILRPGDIFGEAIVPEGRRSFTAVALTDVRAAVIPRPGMMELLASLPAFARCYEKLLCTRLSRMEREFSGIVNGWAYHRLAKELMHLSGDLGIDTPAGTRIALRLTHEELSNLIGARRETVTILLRKFAEMGIILRHGRHITVNRSRLAEYLGVKRE